MKYIIMCGGRYQKWDTPRQLIEINGEPIVARTIRMLKELGIKDISISTNVSGFEGFGVPVLEHDNDYDAIEYNNSTGQWCSAFYPTTEHTCYMFGDVVYSHNAIRTIVDYEADGIMLFGSKAPFAPEYPKWYIEPFAFKVTDTERLKWTVNEVKRLDKAGVFHRKPIAWEFWNVSQGGDPNQINPNYVAINDYTCDIDTPQEIDNVLSHVREEDTMATTKKTETKKARKPRAKKEQADRVTYRGQTFTVLERTENRVKLTDGTIHFWAWAKNVTDVKA